MKSKLFTGSLLTLFFSWGLAAQSLMVTGMAVEDEIPRRVKVELFVQALERDADDAFSETHQRVKAVVKVLKSDGGVKDINLSAIEINRAFDQESARKAHKSFQSISFLLDSLNQFEALIEECLEAGASGIKAIEPQLKEDSDRLDRLYRKAFEGAEAEARRLAAASGLSLGKVMHISREKTGDAPILRLDSYGDYRGFNYNRALVYVKLRVEFALK